MAAPTKTSRNAILNMKRASRLSAAAFYPQAESELPRRTVLASVCPHHHPHPHPSLNDAFLGNETSTNNASFSYLSEP